MIPLLPQCGAIGRASFVIVAQGRTRPPRPDPVDAALPGLLGVPPGLLGVPPGLLGVPPGLLGVPPGLLGVPPGLLGVPQGRVALRRDPGRQPVIEGLDGVGCSIAHCGRHSVLGVAPGHALGLDLEAVRPDLPLDDMAAVFFTAAETGWLRVQPAASRPLAVTLLWCAKEALLKAAGTGIAAGLRTRPLDGLDPSPLLTGAPEFTAVLAGGAVLSLRHGMLGLAHVVMASVSLGPA